MALSINLLAQELEAAVDKLRAENNHRDYKRRYYHALATVIVNHITANTELVGRADEHAVTGGVK